MDVEDTRGGGHSSIFPSGRGRRRDDVQVRDRRMGLQGSTYVAQVDDVVTVDELEHVIELRITEPGVIAPLQKVGGIDLVEQLECSPASAAVGPDQLGSGGLQLGHLRLVEGIDIEVPRRPRPAFQAIPDEYLECSFGRYEVGQRLADPPAGTGGIYLLIPVRLGESLEDLGGLLALARHAFSKPPEAKLEFVFRQGGSLRPRPTFPR